MKKNKGETYGGSGYSEKLEDSNNHYAVVKEDKEDKLKDLIKESLGGVVTTGNPNSLAAMYGQVIRDVMNEDEGTNSLDEFVNEINEDKFDEARQEAIENSQERAGIEEEARPDYPDVDKDGDREESMEKALKDKKDKKVKKESIDSKLTEIGKQGDIVKLEAQLEYLSNHIDEKIDRVSSINEDDNLKELIDKSKMKAMQKEIKLLEKRKGKMEKVYEKMCGKKYARKEMMDEDSNANSNYGSNEGSNENSNDNPAVDQSYSGLEKFRQGVNEEEVDESFDSLAKKLDKQKGVDKEYAGKIAGKIANFKRKGGGKGPTAKQKKRMEEDNEVNWNDKNNPTKGPSGERDPRQVGQSVSPYSTTK